MSDNPFRAGGDEEFTATVKVDRPPEGIAIVQLMNVEQSTSKAGNPMWVWSFQLCEYLEPEEAGTAHSGEPLMVFTALTSAAMWKVEETLMALGVNIAGDGGVTFKKQEVLGVICEATIEHNEFDGNIRPQIGSLRPPKEGAGTKRELSQSFHGKNIPF